MLGIHSAEAFEQMALSLFRAQRLTNPVYKQWCESLAIGVEDVQKLEDIPYLPIAFFKTHNVLCEGSPQQRLFKSSGTGGERSQHWISDEDLYRSLSITAFESFFGTLQQRPVFALLPHYLENGESSLVAMCQYFMEASGHLASGFFLNEPQKLLETMGPYLHHSPAPILIGASYALLDLAESHSPKLGNTLVFETGGMKGRKHEMVRDELHLHLRNGLGVSKIYSEYGMTELLSQAYLLEEDSFVCPPWMQLRLRDARNPLDRSNRVNRGCINIIDLANRHSCAFIATDDLGERSPQGIRILGRLDSADIRGCNLLVI